MTEEALEQTLQAAFPTETASASLHARIEALPPLRHQSLSYTTLGRHILAVIALLWIGHNVPSAIRLWTSKPNTEHILQWEVKKDGKRHLIGETWHKGNSLRSEDTIMGRRITIYTDKDRYEYCPSDNTIHHRKRTDFELNNRDRYISLILSTLYRLILGKINYTKQIFHGESMLVFKNKIGSFYFDSRTEMPRYAESSIGDEETTLIEFDYNSHIADELFEPAFPKNAHLIEDPSPPQPPSAIKRWYDSLIMGNPQ